jgi:TonB-linked SusC/RagA family outer membrane protein
MNMKPLLKSIPVFLLMLFLAAPVWAQFTVTGKVIDQETGESLVGVTIVVKNTTLGTSTNVDGEFELRIPDERAVLRFTYIGYRTEEIAVNAQSSPMRVMMKEDFLGLEEVVVTGLATSVKRENLANSVASVSADELTGSSPSQTISQSLYGKVPGAEISANSGAPGGGISMRMRGVTTINGSSQPLYIVDGVYYNNDDIPNGSNAVTRAAAGGSASNQDNPVNRIADLSPDDIESIEVLKGASAAAIYGQRASGGVVIIKTKRGGSGKPQFSLSQSVGMTTIQKKLGQRDFDADKAEASFGPAGRTLYEEAAAENRFLDYEELMYGEEGLLSKTILSSSFGNESTSFFISGSLQDDEGIIKTTGYQKQSIRANVDHRFGPKFKVAVSSNYTHSQSNRGLTNNDNSGTTFGVSMAATPNFIDLRPDDNGNYPDHPFNGANQIQTRDLFSNDEDVNRVTTSVTLDYQLIQKGNNLLKLTFTGGVDYFSQNNKLIFPSELQFERTSGSPGTLVETTTDNLNTNTNTILVHTFSPSERITLTSQVGYTSFNNDQNRILTISNNILGTQTNVDQAIELNVDQTKIFQRDRGFFLQEEFNFDDTYIVTAGIRGDKSDRNGNVDKIYYYPKASLAWNLSNESFWNFDTFSNLKLRVAYGQTGNLSTFGAKFTSLAPANIDGLGGVLLTNTRGTEDLKPERQSELEAGFDVSLEDEIASLSFTWYQKTIQDMLLQRELEPSTGFSFESFNAGEMRNRGVEVSLDLYPVNSNNLRWTSTINFWKNWSEVTDLPVPAFDVGGFGTSLGVFRIEEGKSATQIVGIDPQVDDNGNLVLDENGAPVIVAKKLGDGEPDFQMSLSNTMNIFKNFDFSFVLHWKKGGDNINLSELLYDLNGTTNDYDDTDLDIADFRLEAAGLTGSESNGVTRLSLLGISSDHFVQDASYLRLREIGLYYRVPVDVMGNLFTGLRTIKLGVSATNLFTFSPYNSYDPEVSNFGNAPIGRGIEVLPYPSSKQYYFHINVEF